MATVATFLPEHSSSTVVQWLRRAEVAVLLLFPYFLWRFQLTFVKPARWFWLLAHALTGVAVIGAFLLPEIPERGEPRGDLFQLYVLTVLLQWVTLSAHVGYRLWRSGVGQPTLARRRMRVLSLASVGLAVALILAGTAPSSDRVGWMDVLAQLVALGSGPLFLLGFAPPGVVRAWWRQPEEAELQDAARALMEALTPADVANALLPHVAHLVGGRASFLLNEQGRLVGSYGASQQDIESAARQVASAQGEALAFQVDSPPVLTVPMRAGWLGVVASVFTPFFGEEEIGMLRDLALLADLALARTELLERERQAHEQLAEAQEVAHVGSWEWDIGSDEVTWSAELYRMLALTPGDFVPGFEANWQLVHPDDRPHAEAAVHKALKDKEPFAYEYRVTRADGSTRLFMARGKVLLDDRGQAVRMIGSVQDITERKKQEAFREQFIANAAHELRTPLSTLLGFSETLFRRRDFMSPQQVEAAFGALKRAGERLTALVNNLLDLSRWQEGLILVRPEPVALAELSKSVVEETPPPSNKRVSVRMSHELVAFADPQRFHQVLSNLLTNAYRYGGPDVVVEASRLEDSVVVSVTDNGPGVEPHLVPDLFDPFVRGTRATTVGGSGLGLAIVKALVEALGGEVWYERVATGGARFSLQLPMAQ